ncbi:MAG: hypothetical protein QM749_11040 [Aquabacterium sp.]
MTAPTLLVHAKEDECSTPRSSYEVANRVQAMHTRVVLLNNCYHMISIDLEKERVLSEMLQFLSHSDEWNQADAKPKRVQVLSLFGNRKGIEQ